MKKLLDKHRIALYGVIYRCDIINSGDASIKNVVPINIQDIINRRTRSYKGFKIIKIVRKYLLAKGGYILSPCSNMDRRPISPNNWCHFFTRVSRSKLRKEPKGDDAHYEDENYCYISFSKKECRRCSNRILRHPQLVVVISLWKSVLKTV